MNFDLVRIIRSMGPLQMAVAVTLLIMAIASFAVFVERLWVIARSRKRAARFAREATDLLARRSYDELEGRASRERGNHLAALLSSGLRAYRDVSARARSGASALELTRRELARKTELLGAELRRGFSVLASVGSVAPFVGLLGTVVGIIGAFGGIAKEGSGGLATVSAGIAEALVVTAFGLLVAIPSVLAFNFLTTKSETIILGLEQARSELVDNLELAQDDDDGSHGKGAQSGQHSRKRGHEGVDLGAA